MEQKQINLDPKKLYLPASLVVVCIIAIIGWVTAQNSRENQLQTRVLLLEQTNVSQDKDIVELRAEAQSARNEVAKLKEVQNDIQQQILDRLTRIETVLGVKKN